MLLNIGKMNIEYESKKESEMFSVDANIFEAKSAVQCTYTIYIYIR